MFDFRDYGNGIYAFDAGYLRPILAAIHMVVENGRVALVDTGTNDSLANTRAALERIGLGSDAVDYVILTHIHLDHAGGAGTMMQAFPAAQLVVHPRGARHMAEPSKLIAGVSAVYGADYVRRVYGDIVPVPAARIVEAVDGTKLSLAGRRLTCLDTPGHARHHICIVDDRTGGIFTGDLFGLSYREMDVGDRPFIFPTTTPSQFEPEAMRQSIARLLERRPEAMYLTHYGRVGGVQAMGEALLGHLAVHEKLALGVASLSGDERHQRLKAGLTRYLLDELRRHGCSLPESRILDLWETDLELNAQGLEVWLDGRRP